MVKFYCYDYIDPLDDVTVRRNDTRDWDKSSGNLHAHEFVEIVYCREGRGTQVIGSDEYPMKRGTLLFLNCGQSHSYASENGMVSYDFLLMPSFISETLINSVDALSLLSLSTFSDIQLTDIMPIIQLSGKEMLVFEHIAEHALQEFETKSPGYRAIIAGYITVLISIIFRKMSLPVEFDATPSSRFNIADVVSYIEKHLNERIGLEELARRSFYNPSYFSRLFKEYSGQSMTDFIHKKRMDLAIEQLKATNLSVGQIMNNIGYRDGKNFYQQFKSYTGMTPKEVRVKSKKTP